MYLEDYRHNDYQLQFLSIVSYKSSPQIELTYNEYSNHGFVNTMLDIQDLENQDNFINRGRRNTLSISMWFLALEAYINALCKITAIIKKKNADEIIRKEIAGRIAFLVDELGYDKMKVRKTGIYNRVNEFRRFRNEIFHDRHSGENLKFEHTLFSPIPIRGNQVDVFQSIQIFLEIVSLFRYSIVGLDMMPNIAIGNEAKLKFEKLDTMYSVFLAPYFQRVLDKLNLKIKLQLSFKLYQLEPSSIFKAGEILPMIKVLQDEKYNISNLTKTNLGEDLYNSALNSDSSTIGMNFVRNWQEFKSFNFEMRD